MKEKMNRYPYLTCWLIFAICVAARIIEYYFIRTDETVFAENFLHKLFGIAVLLIALALLKMSLKDIGFVKSDIINVGKGLLLGLCCFAVSYSLEMGILLWQGNKPSLNFYATGFSLSGGEIRRTAAGFILLCVLFNIINVIMEESLFRGLHLKLAEPVSGFAKANLFSAFLFGIWHWVMPMRDFTDGNLSFWGLIAMGVGYVILAGVMSIKWGLLYKMTGSLWVGLGDHLFNNVIATNLVHVVTANEADSMQIVRIIVAQLLSLVIVILAYKKHIKTANNPIL